MNNSLTKRLLEKATHLQQMSYMTLTAIHPTDRAKPVPSRHISIHNLMKLKADYKQLQVANDEGWGAYVGIGYRKRELQRFQRGGKRDILALPAIFADVDRSPDLVLPQLKRVPQPSLVISSGAGIHIYWFLTTPTTDLAKAERILKGMAIWLDADKSMSNDQIMRLPLSYNTKPDVNAMCSVLMESDQEYELDDFLAYLIFTSPIKVKPSPRIVRGRHRCKAKHKTSSSQTLNTGLSQAVLAELERNYGATPTEKGWYACYCPFGHTQDRRPGDHAYYHPDKGLLNCFGRHGQHLIHSIATQINIDVNSFGGIYQPTIHNRKEIQ
jgi:hypothetical protein